MNRLAMTALGICCLILSGCVEGEVTYIVNPDGSAKVKMDVVSVVQPGLFGGGGGPGAKQPDEETPEDMVKRTVRSLLESPKVAAWKDVSCEILPSGKLKFSGTAYVKKLEDFDVKGIPFQSTGYKSERGADGSFKLVRKEKTTTNEFGSGPRKKTLDQLKKMSDEELDREILTIRVQLQSSKSLLTALLLDAKLKSVYSLPGEPTAVKGFTRDGNRVWFEIDGNKSIAAFNKLLTHDNAAWRKILREGPGFEFFETFVIDEGGAANGSVTVAKPGESQFDFEKEVTEARAAYPQLRKKFGFGDDLKLPKGDGPPRK